MKSYQEMTPIERYEWLMARPVQFADHCIIPGKCPICLETIETHASLNWAECPALAVSLFNRPWRFFRKRRD